MVAFGEKISALRSKLEMSQSDLAQAIGQSQATVSRLEGLEESPSDLKLLSNLASALSTPLPELLPVSFADEFFPTNRADTFYAFCPNPLCKLNTPGRHPGGDVFLRWESNTGYPSEEYSVINFCGSCGSDLVKECSNCGRRIGDGLPQYCVSCGKKVSDRPTPKEWEKIRASHPATEVPKRDDIPF